MAWCGDPSPMDEDDLAAVAQSVWGFIPVEVVVGLLGYLSGGDLATFVACRRAFREFQRGAHDEKLWRPLVDALRGRCQAPPAGCRRASKG